MNLLYESFKISKRGKRMFRYIGLNIEQSQKGVYLDQEQYIRSLEEIEIKAERKKRINEPLTDEERRILRSVCGQLLWVTSQTCPDVAFQGCVLSKYGSNATVKSLVEKNKAIKVLKSQGLKVLDHLKD